MTESLSQYVKHMLPNMSPVSVAVRHLGYCTPVDVSVIFSRVASYGTLAHMPPLDFQQLIHFGVNPRVNYPSIV